MDLYSVASKYVDRLLETTEDSSLRVLVLDKTAASLVALVTTQTTLLKHNIGLLARLDDPNRTPLRTMEAIVFSSTEEPSLDQLVNELDKPLYSQYKIHFNSTVSKPQLERLAEADQMEIVKLVEEMFFNYYVLNSNLFTTVNAKLPSLPSIGPSWDPPSLIASSQTLMSICLSLKVNPFIQVESNSKLATRLAQSLHYEMESNPQLFDQIKIESDTKPMVLILDRKNDPVTPLLFPWTYQSMIHELLTIDTESNMVDLSHINNVSNELQKVIMNSNEDEFYSKSMYLNFGDLSTKLKTYVEEYKMQTKTNSNIGSIKDMKFFLENYPQYKKLSLNLSKHMVLSSEIDKRINDLGIWARSELEQTMCSNNDQSHHQHDLNDLQELLFSQQPLSTHSQKIMLCLYALKYENNPASELSNLLTKINNNEVSNIVTKVLKMYGSKSRMAGIDGSIFNNTGSSKSNVGNWLSHLTGGNETENANVFMQCKPRLSVLLEKIRNGQLKGNNFTTIGDSKGIPRDIIIFFVGGVTYEEARIVEEFNRSNFGIKVAIGGTSIISSETFLQNVSMM